VTPQPRAAGDWTLGRWPREELKVRLCPPAQVPGGP
jgi:hypothetical protein